VKKLQPLAIAPYRYQLWCCWINVILFACCSCCSAVLHVVCRMSPLRHAHLYSEMYFEIPFSACLVCCALFSYHSCEESRLAAPSKTRKRSNEGRQLCLRHRASNGGGEHLE
jgi:hypothetical protein